MLTPKSSSELLSETAGKFIDRGNEERVTVDPRTGAIDVFDPAVFPGGSGASGGDDDSCSPARFVGGTSLGAGDADHQAKLRKMLSSCRKQKQQQLKQLPRLRQTSTVVDMRRSAGLDRESPAGSRRPERTTTPGPPIGRCPRARAGGNRRRG